MIDYKSELNGPQREAVETIEGPVLIIAGAGSGKTRVITHRIAYMLDRGIPQSAILALTFTNKAAREMETRVKELTGKKMQNLWACTFHAFGVKILREEIEALGYRKNFSIYDESDRRDLIRECFRERRTPVEGVDLGALGHFFSEVKNGRAAFDSPEAERFAVYGHIFADYNESLKIYNALDFDDLLGLTIRLFSENPAVLDKYRRRFRYILVDEFQDTSLTQYRLLKLLALGGGSREQGAGSRGREGTRGEEGTRDQGPGTRGEEATVSGTAGIFPGSQKDSLSETPFPVPRSLVPNYNLCVVGDDDQSIYSWRGANFENLLMFERDFPGVREIKLEQNYRSTGTILEAANGVISHNTQRKEKKLWSGQGGGRPIGIFYPDDEDAEGEFIAATIKGLRAGDNYPWRDFGVLTRTNSGSRAIEEAFLANNIPYIVSGGESFFERAEVKDILAYLRVVANSDDDVNLIRIINTPRRGIGKQTIAAVSGEARLARCSLWAALCRAVPRREEEEEFALSGAEEKKPGIRNEEEVSDFLELVNSLKDNFFNRKGNRQNPFSVKVRNMLDQINYRNYLKVEYAKNEKLLKWKLANIEYLLQSIERWEEDAAANGSDAGLWAYLNRVSLLNREDGEDEEGAGKVGLMTIHAAKGLEFPVVFIAGAEKGIIPHERSVEENAGNIEEERRLFYVAITRAREKLILTCCKKRRRQNALADCDPSPFLEEIPPGLIALQEEEKPVEDPAAIREYFAKIKESLAACRA